MSTKITVMLINEHSDAQNNACEPSRPQPPHPLIAVAFDQEAVAEMKESRMEQLRVGEQAPDCQAAPLNKCTKRSSRSAAEGECNFTLCSKALV